MSTRWTTAEEAELRGLAGYGLLTTEITDALVRSRRAVESFAFSRKIRINGRGHESIRAFLDAGGILIREVIERAGPGEPWVHWTPAHRSSAIYFSPAIMDAWLKIGLLAPSTLADNLYCKGGSAYARR
jgi:hypothetical protein